MTKSAAAHELDGTRFDRPDMKPVIDPDQAPIPSPPDDMSEEETAIWHEYADYWSGFLGLPDAPLFDIVVRQAALIKDKESARYMSDAGRAELAELRARQVANLRALGVTAPQRARIGTNAEDEYDPF